MTELQMGDTDQPLKLIYAWKKMLAQYGPQVGKGEGELPAMYLWRNVFFPPAAEQSVRLVVIPWLYNIWAMVNHSLFMLQITDPMALEFLYTDVSYARKAKKGMS